MNALPEVPPCPRCGALHWNAPQPASQGRIGVVCLSCGHRDTVVVVGFDLYLLDSPPQS